MGEQEIREKTAAMEAKLLADVDEKWMPLANRYREDAEREYAAAAEFVRNGGLITFGMGSIYVDR
jgi:hypothetical protein